jgi:hypothetical protein
MSLPAYAWRKRGNPRRISISAAGNQNKIQPQYLPNPNPVQHSYINLLSSSWNETENGLIWWQNFLLQQI